MSRFYCAALSAKFAELFHAIPAVNNCSPRSLGHFGARLPRPDALPNLVAPRNLCHPVTEKGGTANSQSTNGGTHGTHSRKHHSSSRSHSGRSQRTSPRSAGNLDHAQRRRKHLEP